MSIKIKLFQRVLRVARCLLGPFVFQSGPIVNLEVLINDLNRDDLVLVVRVRVLKRLGNCDMVHGSDNAGLNSVVYY